MSKLEKGPQPKTEKHESSISPETLELAEKLHLQEQWEEQVRTLNETGILELLPKSQDIGIVDINGKEQPIPTFEQILKSLDTEEQREILKEKLEQGFTKLLMVPIGLPISIIIDRYKRLLIKKHEQGELKGTDNSKLDLDEKEPIYLENPLSDQDIDSKLIYFPKQFDQKDHQGQTKQELISQGNNWQVILVEDSADIPAENKGKTIKARKQLEANQSSERYLKTIQEDKFHQNEQGPTIESELIYAISELKNKNQTIDDWQGKGKVCRLFGNYLPKEGGSGRVPGFDWCRDGRRADLFWDNPGDCRDDLGSRSGVKIFSK
jgi:hypothetical protein